MKKVFLILAAVLVVLGIIIIAGAFAMGGFAANVFTTSKYVTKSHTLESDFRDIYIDTNTYDVIFEKSADGSATVTYQEREHESHTVTVEDGTLKIQVSDERTWLDRLELFSKPVSIKIALPSDDYGTLEIALSTGDVSVPSTFIFSGVNIESTTGDVDFKAYVTGPLSVKTTTGDITLKNSASGTVDLSVSTGRIKCETVDCSGSFTANVSTGKTTLKDVKCSDFKSSGSTGDITLKNTVASGSFNIERGTGDITFDRSDAGKITVKTSTGDVEGTLLSGKTFITKTSTGRIRVPDNASGGECRITTGTGDINIKIAGN